MKKKTEEAELPVVRPMSVRLSLSHVVLNFDSFGLPSSGTGMVVVQFTPGSKLPLSETSMQRWIYDHFSEE